MYVLILDHILDLLVCPLCRNSLIQVSNNLLQCSKCKHKYSIKNDVIDLLPAVLVKGSDRRWMDFYDKTAENYYRLFHKIIPLITLGLEDRLRRKWVDKLGIKQGDIVLDVSTGTGKNIPFLLKKVGDKGLVFGIDISINMLHYAYSMISKKKWNNVVLIRANASYLPFKDNIFDAVFHVGGINTFEEKEKAVEEMIRVAKPGSRIIVVDGGLKPRYRDTWWGRKLIKSNKLYLSVPPVDKFKEILGNSNVRVKWGIFLNRLLPIWPYYVIEAVKPAGN